MQVIRSIEHPTAGGAASAALPRAVPDVCKRLAAAKLLRLYREWVDAGRPRR